MPVFGQSTGCPILLPFDPSSGCPATCRPDLDGRLPDPRFRSRSPICRSPGLVAPRRQRRLPDGGAPRPAAAGEPASACRSRTQTSAVGRPTSVAGAGASVCRLPGSVDPSTPLTLTRRTVSSSDAAGPHPQEQLGCSVGFDPVTSRSVAAGCPATRCLEACGFSPRPDPLSPRGSGPFSVVFGPRASLDRLGLSIPVGVRSPVRSLHSRMHHAWSRGIFESPGLSTELSINPQDFTVRPPRVHNVVHRLSPRRTADGVDPRPRFDPVRRVSATAEPAPDRELALTIVRSAD